MSSSMLRTSFAVELLDSVWIHTFEHLRVIEIIFTLATYINNYRRRKRS